MSLRERNEFYWCKIHGLFTLWPIDPALTHQCDLEDIFDDYNYHLAKMRTDPIDDDDYVPVPNQDDDSDIDLPDDVQHLIA